MGFTEEIISEAKNLFKENLISIHLYGSQANKKVHKQSDYDLYFILKNPIYKDLKTLNSKLISLEKKHKTKIFINILKEDELPKERYKFNAFYHRNRYAILLLEALNHRVLYGSNSLAVEKLPSFEEFRNEAVKSINLLAYMTRKEIVNTHQKFDIISLKEIAKNVLFAANYALIFNGILVNSKEDVIKEFSLVFPNFSDIVKKCYKFFFDQIDIKDDRLLNDVLNFLEELDSIIFRKYVESKRSKMNFFRNKNMRAMYLEQNNSKDYILYLPGLPNSQDINNFKDLLPSENILGIFYPGTWHSGGKFLSKDFENSLKSDTNELLNKYLKNKPTAIMCSSFGSLALNPFIDISNNIILLSPVIDVFDETNKTSLKELYDFADDYYKEVIRVECKDFGNFMDRLSSMDISQNINKIKNKNILIIHDKKDKQISYDAIIKSVNILKKQNNVKIILTSTGLHGSKLIGDIRNAIEIKKWLKNK